MHHHARSVSGIVLLCGATLIGASSCSDSSDSDELQAQPAAVTSPSFLEFESGPVRPIAISPDRTKLFAVNTPNATLDIFNVTASGLTAAGRVPVRRALTVLTGCFILFGAPTIAAGLSAWVAPEQPSSPTGRERAAPQFATLPRASSSAATPPGPFNPYPGE